jgi:hypothetical protein
MGKKAHRIANEVKADIIRRIKEEGIPVAQAPKSTVCMRRRSTVGWGARVQGTPSWAEFAKIQKQNKELLELVGELTLRLSAAQKKS